MLDFHIDWLPLLGVAAINFFGSWLYYSPMSPFFKIWARGIGMDPNNRQMTPEQKKQMPRMMIGAVIATLLFAYGLQVLIHSLDLNTFSDGMMVGFVAWFAFAVTHSLNTQFEGRKPIVLVINNLWYLVTYLLLGGLVAVWQ